MSGLRRDPGSKRTRRYYRGRRHHCGCWLCLKGKSKRRIIRDRIHQREMLHPE